MAKRPDDDVPRCLLCSEPVGGLADDSPCPHCACRVHEAAGERVAVVTAPEFLDSDNCDAFEASLNRCLQAGIRRFVIDASQLSYMSSAGAGLFVHLLSQVGRGKRGVVFAQAQAPVRELLALLGLDRMLEMADDVTSALARFEA